ncbi:MAG TPA: hypothetical protein VMH80_05160 [Bryobacteraceae bacterium]|nr:hypothetical protein [Bryobacteraceae bacterium]
MPSTLGTPYCANCNTAVPSEDWNREHAFCTVCRVPLLASVFPAFAAEPERASAGETLLEAGEASCFYHPQKRAAVPCDQCGRFLCSLCRVEFLGENWCPACVENKRQKGKLSHLDAHRTLYDNMTLALAILPAFLIWPTVITAPVTLFMTARYWHAPSSLTPRSKIRFVLAAAIAILQIGAWIWLVLFLIYRRR